MKIQWKKLLPCIALPLAVGGLAAFLIKDSMEIFKILDKPPLAPPEWAFPVAWTILCADGHCVLSSAYLR